MVSPGLPGSPTGARVNQTIQNESNDMGNRLEGSGGLKIRNEISDLGNKEVTVAGVKNPMEEADNQSEGSGLGVENKTRKQGLENLFEGICNWRFIMS